MKKSDNPWNKNEKYNKNNETYGKNPRNGRLPNIEFGAMSRQGLENILSCPFSYFWALSKAQK